MPTVLPRTNHGQLEIEIRGFDQLASFETTLERYSAVLRWCGRVCVRGV